MKKTINPILFTAVFFLGVVVFALLREQPKLKEQIKFKDVQLKEAEETRASLRFDVATLQDQNHSLKIEVFERTKEAEKFKQLTKNVQTKYDQAKEEIRNLTGLQADSSLVALYPGVETRSRDILLDLSEGRRGLEMLAISQEEKRGLEKIILAQSDIIRYDSLIITKLEEQVKICDSQLGLQDEQIALYKKRVRKVIWQRNLAIGGAVGIAVLSTIF